MSINLFFILKIEISKEIKHSLTFIIGSEFEVFDNIIKNVNSTFAISFLITLIQIQVLLLILPIVLLLISSMIPLLISLIVLLHISSTILPPIL